MDSQLYLIRAKKLGLKIAMARQNINLTVEDLAEKIGLPSDELIQMEKGIQPPSIPQLQFIASIIQMPIDDLINPVALAPIPAGIEAGALARYFEIRNRMLGIQIKKYRLQQELAIDEVAQACAVESTDFELFESGQKVIPFPVAMKISEFLHLPYEVEHFETPASTEDIPVEAASPKVEIPEPVEPEISPMPEPSSPPAKLSENAPMPIFDTTGLSAELREFISKPINLPFLELAKKLSEMDAKKLRDVAESILEITL